MKAQQATHSSLPGGSDKTYPAKKKEILIFSTGGTIDKIYNEATGELENQGPMIENHLHNLLRLPHTSLHLVPVMSKDSLYMTDDDRDTIAEALKSHATSGFPMIVLHGTDTMDLTARYCQKKITDLKVPIILTGAMKPFGFRDSDALQNVTEALIACQLLGPGVYISFHSNIIPAECARKNKILMTFERIPPDQESI
ncbi:MAG: asparaginase [Deltaproteobacteria bacterium]|nr:asparaginase [Deltaproteobacteria bacterium]